MSLMLTELFQPAGTFDAAMFIKHNSVGSLWRLPQDNPEEDMKRL